MNANTDDAIEERPRSNRLRSYTVCENCEQPKWNDGRLCGPCGDAEARVWQDRRRAEFKAVSK